MIEKYIIRLLYKHDCVVVPGFGGFILNYKHAEVDNARGIFKPPYKELAFNASLTKDDGLLCSMIASEKHITYLKAKDLVTAFVNDISDSLYLRENVYMSGLGSFSLNEENNVVFAAQPGLNFFEDSSWMSNFSLKKVEQVVVTEPFNDDNNSVEEDIKEKSVPLNTKTLLKYAASVIIIFALGILSYFGADYYLQNAYNAGFSFSLNKNSDKPVVDYPLAEDNQVSDNISNEGNSTEVNVSDTIVSEDITATISGITEDANTSENITIPNEVLGTNYDSAKEVVSDDNNQDLVIETVTKTWTAEEIRKDDIVVKPSVEKKSYIVVASYPAKHFDEAKEYALSLRESGFSSASVIFSQGRNRVAAYCGTDSIAIQKELTTVKNIVTETAWILYY